MSSACPQCATPAGDGAKFCPECGARLVEAEPEERSARKVVTALFCDLVGSTALGEQTDPEVLRAVLQRYFGTMRDALERHGGTVEKFIGDAVVAFFGVPVAREDDAVRAVRAAFEMHAALGVLNDEISERWGIELRARIGLNTGEVLVTGSADHTVGDAINVAARFEQAAGPGEVIVGERTWQLIRDWAECEAIEPLDLRGKASLVPAWKVHSIVDVTSAPPPRGTLRTNLVGRERELALLQQSFERAIADRSCQLFTVFGSAGVGKSRLSEELVTSLGAVARVVKGRCLSYGDGTALWPLLEMLQESSGSTGAQAEQSRRLMADAVAGDSDSDRVIEVLAPLAGLGGTPAAIEEVRWAARRWIELLGRTAPVVWVVEDLHWAEPAMLSIIEEVADWTRDTPVLLLCLARPEFLDDHPSWGGGKLNAVSVLLKPLTEDQSASLVGGLLGDAQLPGEVVRRVIAGSGGTPLFIEQLLAMLIDDGLLRRANHAWEVVGDLGSLQVPATISALLTARLERLSADEREVLDAASVVGLTFYAGGVAELADVAGPQVTSHLRSLARKELIREERSDLPGEQGFAFAHILLRDTAYQALPKLRRADLHERFARWLNKRLAQHPGEFEDFIGHHLAQAVILRRELGASEDDRALVALAEEAASRLAATGRRLMDTDLASSAELYMKAAELEFNPLPRAGFQYRQALALLRSQEFSTARALLDAVRETAADLDEPSLSFRIELSRLESQVHTGDQSALAQVEPTVMEAVEHFSSTGDVEGLALAHAGRITVLAMDGRWRDLVSTAETVTEFADRCSDQHLTNISQAWRWAGLIWGPAPAASVAALLHQAQNSPRRESLSHFERATHHMVAGYVAALGDRADEARRRSHQAQQIFEETRSTEGLLHFHFVSGTMERVLANDAEGERHFLAIFEPLERAGEASYLSTVAPLLGEIRLRQGNVQEARRLEELGRSLTLDEDVLSQTLWRVLAAKIAAAEADLAQALQLASEALKWVSRTDHLVLIGDVYSDHAAISLAADRRDLARTSLAKALELYEAKGDVPDTERTRVRLQRLTDH